MTVFYASCVKTSKELGLFFGCYVLAATVGTLKMVPLLLLVVEY